MTQTKLTLDVLLQAAEADATSHSSAAWRLVVVQHWYAIEEVRKLQSNRVVAARRGQRAALYLLARIPSGQHPARLSLHRWCTLFNLLLTVIVEDGGGEGVGHRYERRERSRSG